LLQTLVSGPECPKIDGCWGLATDPTARAYSTAGPQLDLAYGVRERSRRKEERGRGDEGRNGV